VLNIREGAVALGGEGVPRWDVDSGSVASAWNARGRERRREA